MTKYIWIFEKLDQITPQELIANPYILEFAERMNYTKWI